MSKAKLGKRRIPSQHLSKARHRNHPSFSNSNHNKAHSQRRSRHPNRRISSRTYLHRRSLLSLLKHLNKFSNSSSNSQHLSNRR